MSEQMEQAFAVLRNYQLLSKDSNGIERVYEIWNRYKKFEDVALLSKHPLHERVSNVMQACITIELAIQEEAERTAKNLEKFSEDYRNYVSLRGKVFIQEAESHPYPKSYDNPEYKPLLELYSKSKARTHKQKLKLLRKVVNRDLPFGIDPRGIEPKWNTRMRNVRAMEHLFFLDFIEGHIPIK